MINEFKSGQRVKIVEGGWGIHPDAVGLSIVLIDCPAYGQKISASDYFYSAHIPHPIHEEAKVWFAAAAIQALPDVYVKPVKVDDLIAEIQKMEAELKTLKEELKSRVEAYLNF